jgi:trehalose-6-phosphate synthase
VLPVYGELVNALLTCDVLGFQTESDVDSFRSPSRNCTARRRAAGRRGARRRARVRLDAFPIGVDVDGVQREARSRRRRTRCAA